MSNLNIKNIEPGYSFILVSTLHNKIKCDYNVGCYISFKDYIAPMQYKKLYLINVYLICEMSSICNKTQKNLLLSYFSPIAGVKKLYVY